MRLVIDIWRVLIFAAWLLPCLAASFRASDYSGYILAPSTRTLAASSIYRVRGNVTNVKSLLQSTTVPATIHGPASATLDFGRNVAGIVSIHVGKASKRNTTLGVTFSESSAYVSSQASDATQDAGLDKALLFDVGAGPGTYTASKAHSRGAFRYLTIVGSAESTIDVEQVTVNFTAAPTHDLAAPYRGYFHCDDELLNRIWYAGAYTTQLCTIDPSMGSALNVANLFNSSASGSVSWWANTTIANGSSVLTDGAKRNRVVWPGDMAISLTATAVSTYDLDSIKNALDALLNGQTPDGRLPYTTPPLPNPVSFGYHCIGLVSVIRYYIYSGDRQWLTDHWSQFVNGIQWALSNIDATGLANVPDGPDWRSNVSGHVSVCAESWAACIYANCICVQNIEGNALLYYTLSQAIILASRTGMAGNLETWSNATKGIQSAANQLLWDAELSLYRNDETSTLYPQDGNAWAVMGNLTATDSQAKQITRSLRDRWGQYGAPAPEAGRGTISPFVSGLELQAHYQVGDAGSALDLMRLEWGFMLNDPRMTNSTLIEGYSTNGSLH